MPISVAPVQYTIRGVPRDVDAALRRKARRRGISLNQLLVEEISAASGGGGRRILRDLSDLPRWKEDVAFDRILEEQRAIDLAIWK